MEFQKVIEDDSSVLMFAKMQCEGHGTGLEKSDWLKIINGRASDLYGDTLTRERRFTKAIVEDETGRLLYKALKAAPGFEVTSAVGDTPELEAKTQLTRGSVELGPGHAKMHSMAIDHQRAHPTLSYEGAYSVLYAKPENAELRNQIKAEHIAATMARVHA